VDFSYAGIKISKSPEFCVLVVDAMTSLFFPFFILHLLQIIPLNTLARFADGTRRPHHQGQPIGLRVVLQHGLSCSPVKDKILSSISQMYSVHDMHEKFSWQQNMTA